MSDKRHPGYPCGMRKMPKHMDVRETRKRECEYRNSRKTTIRSVVGVIVSALSPLIVELIKLLL